MVARLSRASLIDPKQLKSKAVGPHKETQEPRLIAAFRTASRFKPSLHISQNALVFLPWFAFSSPQLSGAWTGEDCGPERKVPDSAEPDSSFDPGIGARIALRTTYRG